MAGEDLRDLGRLASIDSGSTRGLEVRLWVVDDTDWAVARSLVPYLDDFEGVSRDGHADPLWVQTRSRWSDWGFRTIMIPMDQVEGFLGQLRPVQPISVQWLGEFGHWRAIVRAGELGTNHVRVGQRLVEIDHGRPRLIARSWIEPMLTLADVVPAVRLDLGLQIEINDSRSRQWRQSGFFEPGRERSIEDDGPVIDELMRTVMLDGSQALIIVGEAPGVDWNRLADSVGASALGEEAAEGEKADDQDSEAFGPNEGQNLGQNQGQDQTEQAQSDRHDVRGDSSTSLSKRPRVDQPSKPMGQSLGELMLMSPGSRTVRLNQPRTVSKRVIVVLIPRVEGGYSLLPEPSSRGQTWKKGSRP